jgi:hypothetical protein
MSRETKITGPALTGSARVLAVRRTGWAQGNYPARIVLRFDQRVEIPGREPYDVTGRQNFEPWAIPAAGMTVPVQVDSTDLQKVRMDFTQPITPSGAESFGEAPAARFPQSPVGPRGSAAELLTPNNYASWTGMPLPAKPHSRVRSADYPRAIQLWNRPSGS